jgi:DNA-binding NarL/FixJ family response regulator
MRAQHFEQMIDLVDRGHSWFPPAMLQDTFALARQAVTPPDTDTILAGLTDREKQTAVAVSNGLSNRAIAEQFDISERTVKTHLTNIFKKLDINDRVALVLMLKG